MEYDISTAAYRGVVLDVGSQNVYTRDILFNNDGTSLYYLGDVSNNIYEYTLSTAYDISTATYDSVALSSVLSDPRSIVFNDDGTILYLLSDWALGVGEYTLSTAYDISTATYDSVVLDISSQVATGRGLLFNDDGTSLYISNTTDRKIYEYTLSTAYDISTATYDSVALDTSAVTTTLSGIIFNGDGTSLYTLGANIYEYTLSTAYDISTATYDSLARSVSSQDSDPRAIIFDENGESFYLLGDDTNQIFEYLLVALSDAVSDTYELSDLSSAGKELEDILSLSFNVSSNLSSSITAILLEIANISDTLTPEEFANVVESIRASGVLSTLAIKNTSITESTVIHLLSLLITPVILEESVEISDEVVEILHAFRELYNTLSVSDIPVTSLEAGNTLSATIGIIERLLEITPVVEEVLCTLNSSEFINILLQSSDIVEISDTQSEYIRFTTIVEESPELDDAISSSSILHALLQDSSIFSVSFGIDATQYTGWVMNPENYAITNYTNHPFNSSTSFNNNTLFAGETGLYLLGGTTDDTTTINAKLKTAAMSFGTSNLKQVPEVLLGVDNSGKVILIANVDGKYTTTYELIPSSDGLSTQQIKIGKGLYGRYWQFELQTKDNSTFDLDSFEFLPVSFGRKI